MKEHEIKHPAITMSRARARVWLKDASDEDFYQFIRTLSAIYGKRKYPETGTATGQQLFDDYKDWREKVVGEIKT